MSFFWPTTLKSDPGGIGRLGRVLHWFFALCACAFVVGGAYYVLSGIDTQSGMASIVFGGGSCLMFGRALRYILAGE